MSSANQRPVDSTYPYYLGREYPTPRGFIINQMLADTIKFNPERMKKMQTDNYNAFAEWARPFFLKNINAAAWNKSEQRYFELLSKWDLRNDPQSVGATVFVLLWKNLKPAVFEDEFKNAPQPILMPFERTLLESLLRDSAWKFIDNISLRCNGGVSRNEPIHAGLRLYIRPLGGEPMCPGLDEIRARSPH